MNVALTNKQTDQRDWLQWLWQTQLGLTLLSLVLSLLALVIMVLIYGGQPIQVLSALFEGALRGKESVIATLEEMTTLILTGLAVLLPYKAGYFNIGGQGQLEIGGLAAVFVATTVTGPPLAVILLSLAAAIIVAMVVSVFPMLLKIKRGASEVTTAIMVNFVITNFIYALIMGPLKDPKAFYGTTRQVPEIYQLAVIPKAVGFHAGVWLALVIAVFVFWWINKSVFGLQLSAVGYNARAAEAAGMKTTKIIILGVLMGAAMAGLAGGIVVLGVTSRVAQGWAMNWGFTGVSVAFLGGNALGVIPVAFLLSILSTGARYMQAMTGVPEALVSIMQGIPVLAFIALTAARLVIKDKKKPKVKKNEPTEKVSEEVKA